MKTKTDSLEKRMKLYQTINRKYFIPKQPVIIKLKLKNFSKFINQDFIEKPFSYLTDVVFKQTILQTCTELQNIEFAFYQLNEVSFFLKDYNNINQTQLFNGDVQKIVSTISSLFTYYFNRFLKERFEIDGIDEIVRPVFFDSDAAISIPLHEVENYFMWRQNTGIKNSVNIYASYFFTKEELFKKNTSEKQKMLREINKNWEELPLCYQRGVGFLKKHKSYLTSNNRWTTKIKWSIDTETPLFYEEKKYLNNILN